MFCASSKSEALLRLATRVLEYGYANILILGEKYLVY